MCNIPVVLHEQQSLLPSAFHNNIQNVMILNPSSANQKLLEPCLAQIVTAAVNKGLDCSYFLETCISGVQCAQAWIFALDPESLSFQFEVVI